MLSIVHHTQYYQGSKMITSYLNSNHLSYSYTFMFLTKGLMRFVNSSTEKKNTNVFVTVN